MLLKKMHEKHKRITKAILLASNNPKQTDIPLKSILSHPFDRLKKKKKKKNFIRSASPLTSQTHQFRLSLW